MSANKRWARGLYNGYVPTEKVMAVVDNYLAQKQKTNHEEPNPTQYGDRLAPIAPMRLLAKDSGIPHDTIARRLWGYRNQRIGYVAEMFGEGSAAKFDADGNKKPVPAVVSPWMDFNEADRLMCGMRLDWRSELGEIYQEVNLGCVECGEYQCECQAAVA